MKKNKGIRFLSVLCALFCLLAAALPAGVAAAPAASGGATRFEPEDEGEALTAPESEGTEQTGGAVAASEDESGGVYTEDEVPEASEDEESDTVGVTDTYDAVQLDSFTGKVKQNTSSSLIELSNTCKYDRELEEFIYEVNNLAGSSYTTNIPNGAAVQMSVELRIPENLLPTLYRNGEALSNPSWDNITDKGTYSLSINVDGEIVPAVFTFSILGSYVSQSYVMNIPDWFRIRSVNTDFGTVSYSDYEVSLEEEGEYTITYACDTIGKAYSISFTVDHTAPELAFEGITDNLARGPVTILNYNNEDTLVIFCDKTQVPFTQPLTTVGSYVVTVTDPAGNCNTYTFAIRPYLDMATWAFMGALFVLAVLALFFIGFKRKKFRSN